jgi:hypothetical protein
MKMLSNWVLGLLPGIFLFQTSPSNFPVAEISKGLLRVGLYLPDARTGYYRGSRFDWSGVMPSLEYHGHQWCGQWFDSYNPTTHDAIMGPVEAFEPLGYEKAPPGGKFIGIGIGLLSKTESSRYSPYVYYKVLDPGVWKIDKGRGRIRFRQKVSDGVYAYDYEKTVSLSKGKAVLVLSHRLRNTGHMKIETTVYDHNLFFPDHLQTGPGTVIRFPFRLTAKNERGMGEFAVINDRQIEFRKRLDKKESAYCELSGYSDSAKDYDIEMENQIAGVAVRITCDRPLVKLVFWASSTTACPEPYIRINIDPGETFQWTINYEFHSSSIKP